MSRGKKQPRRSAVAEAPFSNPLAKKYSSDWRLVWVAAVGSGFIGGAIGAAAGYFAFGWLKREHGVYAIVLPAVLMGLGCGLGMQRRIPIMGLICATAAGVLTLLIEWQNFPFAEDPSFGYFVTHLAEKPPIRMGLFAFATLLAGWFGCGRDES